MTDIVLRLELDDDPAAIARDARGLVPVLSDKVDPNARLATAEGAEGTRAGTTMLLGQIAMGLVSSGAVVALLEVVKSYFARKRSARISVTGPDGRVVTIERDDLSDAEFERTLDKLIAFTGVGAPPGAS